VAHHKRRIRGSQLSVHVFQYSCISKWRVQAPLPLVVTLAYCSSLRVHAFTGILAPSGANQATRFFACVLFCEYAYVGFLWITFACLSTLCCSFMLLNCLTCSGDQSGTCHRRSSNPQAWELNELYVRWRLPLLHERATLANALGTPVAPLASSARAHSSTSSGNHATTHNQGSSSTEHLAELLHRNVLKEK
jgi:hypothetical protein